MSGILWGLASGVGFGIFQTLNRKAGQGVDTYRGTFLLILISAVIMGIGAVLTEDVSLLWSAPFMAIVYFALAGFVHFFLGWTFIAISQGQIGAARTGAIMGTTPLFGAVVAAVTIGELLSIQAALGVVLIVVGVYFVTTP